MLSYKYSIERKRDRGRGGRKPEEGERDGHTHTNRERDKERKREKERQRERERQRQKGVNPLSMTIINSSKEMEAAGIKPPTSLFEAVCVTNLHNAQLENLAMHVKAGVDIFFFNPFPNDKFLTLPN